MSKSLTTSVTANASYLSESAGLSVIAWISRPRSALFS